MVLIFPYLGMKLTQFWSGIKRTCWIMQGDIDNFKNNVLKIRFLLRLPLHVQTIVTSLYIFVILFGTGANLTILVTFCTNKVQSMSDPLYPPISTNWMFPIMFNHLVLGPAYHQECADCQPGHHRPHPHHRLYSSLPCGHHPQILASRGWNGKSWVW